MKKNEHLFEREIYQSSDGSTTLYWPKYDEHYHSIHGAIAESKHVFIQAGLQYMLNKTSSLRILEIGFGTGLNALLSCLEIKKHPNIQIMYDAIEPYPLQQEEVAQINFSDLLNCSDFLVDKMHQSIYKDKIVLSENFTLIKHKTLLQNFNWSKSYDLVYYDAFAPSAQPELWECSIFESIFAAMSNNSCLVTYCAKGQVKRNLKAVGFHVEALPGPPRKREITRAIKL